MKRSSIAVIALLVVIGIGALVWVAVSEKAQKLSGVVPGTETGNATSTEKVLSAISLVSKTITFGDGTKGDFRIADGFEIDIAAEGLGKARFMAMSPDGRLFIPDLVDQKLSHEGRIRILSDFDDATHQFKKTSTYLSGLRGPNSVAFYKDKDGKQWIYLTLTDRLIRYPYKAGDTVPSGTAQVIAKFPDFQSPTATGVVWHITRTILFHDDTLFVSVGSGCNSCEQPSDEVRAVILAMDPDGKNSRVYAHDIKNAVGLLWANGSLYATENGVDHLGVTDPDDLMYKVSDGKNYGWPYCYEVGGKKKADNSSNWKRTPTDCATVPMSFAAFEPHSAPLGLTYFEKAPPTLEGAFLVALHGSFKPEIGNGYQLMRVSTKGEQAVFMDGFQDKNGDRIARAVDILQKDVNSFFMTDDFGGRLFYIYAK